MEGTMTRVSSRASIYGLIGLTAFGVAYDSGLFGPTDGHDHSAVVSMPLTAGTSTGLSLGSVYVPNAVTGEDVVVPAVTHKPPVASS
jgi:hypothetical protein